MLGQLEGAVAQYDDTPEAQHKAQLRAAEQEREDKLLELHKRQDAAQQEEIGNAKATPLHTLACYATQSHRHVTSWLVLTAAQVKVLCCLCHHDLGNIVTPLQPVDRSCS